MLRVVSPIYWMYLQVKCWYRIINNTYNCKPMFLKTTGHNYRFIVRNSVILYNYVKKRCISFAVNVILWSNSPKGYQLDLSATLKKHRWVEHNIWNPIDLLVILWIIQHYLTWFLQVLAPNSMLKAYCMA